MVKRRKLSEFILFFGITFILWFFIKLSESHNAILNFDIAYVSVPDDKLILGNPTASIDVSIKAGGYAIIRHRIFKRTLKLDVSRAENKDGVYVLNTQYLEAAVKEQLDKDVSFQNLQMGFIAIELGKNSEKKVPITPNLTVLFERDFDLYGDFEINPDSITVSGPENVVDTLSSLETEKIVLNDVNTDFSVEAALVISEALEPVQLSAQTIQIKGKVVRYTEKILEVPIIINNKPDQVSIRLFPDKVNVKCRGSLLDIKKVLADDVLVVADFNEIEDKGVLIPTIKKYPEYLRSAEILDKKVEFLIKKE
ncbi:CdaR family protein [Ascidiimonas sp. W6]|uniref:CdaR family protein n=1 Tax=Ascidiimonas meishanensis TaxID=3128903 RepID=UPI0030EE2E43